MTRIVLLISLALLFGGCAMPLPQLNYRGVLKKEVTDPLAVSDQFATSLAREAHLKIVDRTHPLGVARLDSSASVHLRSEASSKIWVIVTAYASERMLITTIGGDFSSAAAMEIARASERVFSQLYPDSSYTPFQAHSGILGP